MTKSESTVADIDQRYPVGGALQLELLGHSYVLSPLWQRYTGETPGGTSDSALIQHRRVSSKSTMPEVIMQPRCRGMT